jgi:hypothetical protein
VVTLLGALAPFAQASDVLQRLTGLRFSTATCRRVTERVGAELHAWHQQQTLTPPTPPDWDFTLPERDGQHFAGAVGYVGLDAVAVPTRGDGRVDWKMLYVGLLYDPRKDHTLYLVDYDFEQLAGRRRRYAVTLHFGQAPTVVALTDGGAGLERVLRQGFSGAVALVLDWWHASQKLHALGGLLHEADPGAATAWAKARENTLWEQGGAALVAELEGRAGPTGASAEVGAQWQEGCGYFRRNVHRTDYPTYRARGWDVGSGPTEAGCKVVGQRVKGPGMRWLQGASAEVATLKALYASGMGLWEAFWEQRQPKRDPQRYPHY